MSVTDDEWREARARIAKDTGWPPGVLGTCRDLEAEFDGWRVTYYTGRQAEHPRPDFSARHKDLVFFHPHADALRTMIAAEEAASP